MHIDGVDVQLKVNGLIVRGQMIEEGVLGLRWWRLAGDGSIDGGHLILMDGGFALAEIALIRQLMKQTGIFRIDAAQLPARRQTAQGLHGFETFIELRAGLDAAKKGR